MNTQIRLAFALALAGMIGSASAAGERGREVYERHCRTCHGGTTPADSPLGPSLVGISEVHGTIMPARVSDSEALEQLLDYLESLR